jgi:endonuclease YncB( thermonuclease family)
MQRTPFINPTRSKLLLIGSAAGVVLILGFSAFMILNEVEAQSSPEVTESNPQVLTDQAAITSPAQEASLSTDAQAPEDPSAALESPGTESELPPVQILAIDSVSCIPNNVERQIASVTDVIDADTLSVSIDGELSTVKYLGIDTQGSNQSVLERALSFNQSLVGQTVTLMPDVTDADAQGRLLRFVLADESFINQYFLEQGLGTAFVTPPDEACREEFQAAQELAISKEIGTWEPLKPNDWREWLIVPTISDNAVEIYLRGLEDGVNTASFSMIGDCLSIPERLFRKVSWGDFTLPDGSEYLQSTVEQFRPAWNRQPVTVEGGFVGASMFSIYFSDPDRCGQFETPIDCEFRLNNPSIAIISIGTDQKPGTDEEFEFYMREIVEYSIERNVLPIIATKADPTEEDFPLNHIMAQLADEYDIPLWNFWASVQHLPNTGLNPVTGIHLTAEANSIRRLTAIQVLHAVLTAAQR